MSKVNVLLLPGCHCTPRHFSRLETAFVSAGYNAVTASYQRQMAGIDRPQPARLVNFFSQAREQVTPESGQWVLMGHSMGGILAQALAATIGESQIAGLVLLNTVPPQPKKPRYDWGKQPNGGTKASVFEYLPTYLGMGFKRLLPFFGKPEIQAKEKWVTQIFANAQDREFQNDLFPTLVAESPEVYWELGFPKTARQPIVAKDYPKKLQGIPALILGGETDRMFEWQASEKLAKAMGDRARFVKLSGDHWSIDGRFVNETIEQILPFLEQCRRPA